MQITLYTESSVEECVRKLNSPLPQKDSVSFLLPDPIIVHVDGSQFRLARSAPGGRGNAWGATARGSLNPYQTGTRIEMNIDTSLTRGFRIAWIAIALLFLFIAVLFQSIEFLSGRLSLDWNAVQPIAVILGFVVLGVAVHWTGNLSEESDIKFYLNFLRDTLNAEPIASQSA